LRLGRQAQITPTYISRILHFVTLGEANGGWG
jgi:hypothetical protein